MATSKSPKRARQEIMKTLEENNASEESVLQKKIYKYYSRYSKYQDKSYSWPMKVFEKQHSSQVRCCSYSPDGNYLATGSGDKRVKIWNIKEQKEEFTLNGHLDMIYCCSYSPDGNYLSTGSYQDIKIWNIKERKEEFTLNGHSSWVNCCSYSPDGNYLATGSEDKLVKIWNLKEQREEFVFNQHSYPIMSCSYSPDGNYLATGSEDKTIKIWNIKEQREEFFLTGHSNWIKCCSYSPDGNYLATGSEDRTVKIWNLNEKREQFTLYGHTGSVYCCSYSPDGNYLATGSFDKTVKIWNIKEQREQFTFNGNSSWVCCCSYSPDGYYLATGSFDKKVKIWNIKDIREEVSLTGDSVNYCSYSPDGNYLAIGSEDRIVKIWNIKEQREEINLDLNHEENKDSKFCDWEKFQIKERSSITIPIYSKYGLFKIVCCDNGNIKVLNSSNGKEIFVLSYGNSSVKGLFCIQNERFLIALYKKNIFKITLWNKLLYIIHENLSRFIIERKDIKLLFKDAKVAKFIFDYNNEYNLSKVKIEMQLVSIVSKFFFESIKNRNIQMALDLCKYIVKFAKLNYKICHLEKDVSIILTKYYSDTKNKRNDIKGKYDIQILMFYYDTIRKSDENQKIRILLNKLIKIREFENFKIQIYDPWSILEMKKFINIEELSENNLFKTIKYKDFTIEFFISFYSTRKVLVKKYVLNEKISKERKKLIMIELKKEAKCYELLENYRSDNNYFCEYFGSINLKNNFSIVINSDYLDLFTLIDELKILKSKGEYNLPVTQLAIIVNSLVESFAFLASHNILHRSISSSSLLVDENFNFSIIDFYFAAIKIDDIWYESLDSSLNQYKSPEEEIENSKLDLEKCDVYSLGLVILQLTHLVDVSELKQNLESYIQVLERMNLKWLQTLLGKMLCKSEDRLYFYQLRIFLDCEETISNSIH